ncbi:MAG TPA: HXXEE domain-containing protein [Anaerolineae bacterium]|nr:HXXEE domain-containing protein [Anaerolineae bacterium]
MSITTQTLLWLFPITFMFHDFEEILFWEAWLNKHGAEIEGRIPAFMAKRVSAIVKKSTAQAALPICLIFSLTVLSTFVAAEYGNYELFLLASGVFFVHAFMHLGQALILRSYVPAIVTSALIIIPYSLILFGRLTEEGIVTWTGLLIHFLVGVILLLPFILLMHQVGDYLLHKITQRLVN